MGTNAFLGGGLSIFGDSVGGIGNVLGNPLGRVIVLVSIGRERRGVADAGLLAGGLGPGAGGTMRQLLEVVLLGAISNSQKGVDGVTYDQSHGSLLWRMRKAYCARR